VVATRYCTNCGIDRREGDRLAFGGQLSSAIDAAGGSAGDVFSAIDAGAYVALGGGISLQISR
jgi:hypothetical protein